MMNQRSGILSALMVLAPLVGSGAHGRTPPSAGPYLFVLDLQRTPLDEFPDAVKALNGVMTVVEKDGQHMLMASSPSELLITLPQVLPAEFTVEVDLVPKRCCNPEDLMLEGTPARNRGVASVELTWHPAHIMAVGGGGEMYQSDTPADLAALTPGNLTHLVFTFSGTTIKLYTNGRRLYTLDKQFVRGRVLRVWLGGESATNPMYLAGLRIGDGPASPKVIAGNAGESGASGNPGSQPQRLETSKTDAEQTASNQRASTGSMLPTVVANVTVVQATAGPVVNWLPVAVPAVYSVARWKLDDPACCRNASPPTPVLNAPPWQDAPLPVAGTYVYEVTATMTGGVATGQGQFLNLVAGSRQIASVAPGSAPVTAVPATQTGTITPTSQSTAPVLPAPSSLPTLAPPPPPVVSAPIGREPRVGGTSSLIAGPASLTASRIGWGVELRWPEVVGAAEYQVESGATGQTFAVLATVQYQFQPVQAGTFSLPVQNMQPGSTTFYRVRAVLSDGTVTPYSPVVRHDAPLQVPYVSKVVAFVTRPAGSPGFRSVRWGWAQITGVDDATRYDIQTDVFALDATGALIPVSGGSKRRSTLGNLYEDEFTATPGNSVRFCISVVFPPSMSAPIQYAVCQTTAIQ